ALGEGSRPTAVRTCCRSASGMRCQVPSSRHWAKGSKTVLLGGQVVVSGGRRLDRHRDHECRPRKTLHRRRRTVDVRQPDPIAPEMLSRAYTPGCGIGLFLVGRAEGPFVPGCLSTWISVLAAPWDEDRPGQHLDDALMRRPAQPPHPAERPR